jgi:hypothetical protein
MSASDGSNGGRDLTALVLLLATASWLTAFALFAFWRVGTARSDFSVFIESGRAWLSGNNPYQLGGNPNLNPPTAIVCLLGPLARLPFAVAQIIWTVGGAVALLFSTRLLANEIGLTRIRALWALAILNITHAAFLIWMQGQMTWLLLYPVTRAWLAFRRGNPVSTGLWLAPAIALKPILALVALALPWRVWATAGLTSALIAASTIPWTGWELWESWLRVGSDVAWLEWPPNASLWGLAARLQSGMVMGSSLADLNRLTISAVIAAAGVALVQAVREPNADRRFTFAVLWMVLMSPLGWIYYLPMGLAPMAATWPRSRAGWVAIVLLSIPFPAIQAWLYSPGTIRTLGSVYGSAVLIAWIAFRQSHQYERTLRRGTEERP